MASKASSPPARAISSIGPAMNHCKQRAGHWSMLVDEASEHFAPAREGVIPLDSPVAHVGPGHAQAAANPPPPRRTLREQSRRPRGYLTEQWRPIGRVLLPFAIGFYLTNLFRTINALISDQLTSDLALG